MIRPTMSQCYCCKIVVIWQKKPNYHILAYISYSRFVRPTSSALIDILVGQKGNNFTRFDNEFDALHNFYLISGAFCP